MDDFLIPARIARAGRRVVFAGGAVAREDAAKDVAAEVRRRLRIGIGAGQVLRRELWLWNAAAHPALTFAFASRKAARWLAPLLALASAAAALFVLPWRFGGAAALALAGRGAGPRSREARAGAPGPDREALLFRRAESRPGARRRPRAFRAQSSLLDADGSLLMSSGRPSAFRAVALAGDVAIAAACLGAAFLIRRHVTIPGTLALLPAGSVRFTAGNIATVAAVQVFALSFFGLYRDHERFREPLARLLLPALFVELLSLAAIYFLAQPYSFPRSVLVLFVRVERRAARLLADRARPPLPAAHSGAP